MHSVINPALEKIILVGFTLVNYRGRHLILCEILIHIDPVKLLIRKEINILSY